MKVYSIDIDCCFACPQKWFSEFDKKDYCGLADSKEITDEELFVRDEKGNALKGNMPDWCPLPDKEEQ